jgi:hypothetical protein
LADDERNDEAIVERRLSGRSVRSIAKQFGCSPDVVEAAIDRRLGDGLSNDARRRAIILDAARLDALLVPFFEKATSDTVDASSVAAGTLCCKLLERRASILGLDQPTQSRVDVYQVEAQQAPSSYDEIHAAIMGLVEQASPAEKALRKRLEQVSAERALELLGPPQLDGGNGESGAVDGLSEPSH